MTVIETDDQPKETTKKSRFASFTNTVASIPSFVKHGKKSENAAKGEKQSSPQQVNEKEKSPLSRQNNIATEASMKSADKQRSARRESRRLTRHSNAAYASNLSMNIINYIVDTLESILEQMSQRVPSIPITIRVYCKALHDKLEAKGKSKIEIQRVLAKYVIQDWLGKIAFDDFVVYGLLKACAIK